MDDSLGTRYNEGLGHALDISFEGPICSSFRSIEVSIFYQQAVLSITETKNIVHSTRKYFI